MTFKVSSSPKGRTLFSSSWQEYSVAKANMPRLQVSMVSKSWSKEGGAHAQSLSCPCSSARWHPLQPPTSRCYSPHCKPVSWKSKPGDHLTSKANFKGADEATQAFFKERAWPSSGNHLLRSVSLPKWLITCKILWRLIHRPRLRGMSFFMKMLMIDWGKQGICSQVCVLILAFPLASCVSLGQVHGLFWDSVYTSI